MKNPLSPSSSSQNTKSTLPPQQSSSKRRLPRWVVFVLVGVVIVMGVIVIYNMMNGGGMNIGESVEQRKMEEYLEEKYGEEFVVSKPEYKNSGLGVEGTWGAEAYPINAKDVRFHVGSYREKYSDYYVAALWTKQAEKEMRPIIHRVYGEDSSIVVKPSIWITPPLVYTATKSSPTFTEAKALENGFSYNILITNNDLSEDELHIDTEKMYLLVEELKLQGVKRFAIDYKGHSEGNLFQCYLDNNNFAQYNQNNIATECMRKAEE